MSIFDSVKQLFVPIEDVAKEVPSKLKILAAGRGVQGLFTDQPAPDTFSSAFKEGARKNFSLQEPEMLASNAMNLAPMGMTARVAKIVKPAVFKGLEGLSTKLLEKFRGMPEEITSQQFNEVLNKAKKEGVRQADESLIMELRDKQLKYFRENTATYEKVPKGELGHDSGAVRMINQPKINLTQLAKDAQTHLVPLTPTEVKSPRWSNVGQDFIGDGKYGEVVYQSPIKTSAGDVHYPTRGMNAGEAQGWGGWNEKTTEFPRYFSHVRYEDMADGKTRKILETQSDLMQKENFAREVGNVAARSGEFESGRLSSVVYEVLDNDPAFFSRDSSIMGDKGKIYNFDQIIKRGKINESAIESIKKEWNDDIGDPYFRRLNGIKKSEIVGLNALFDSFFEKLKTIKKPSRFSNLEPYNSNDPLAQLRTFREEVKRAAQDGKDTILIPSGDTAMKIEGLGEKTNWYHDKTLEKMAKRGVDTGALAENGLMPNLRADQLKVGESISQGAHGQSYIITDVLGDGKFKAIPKDSAYTEKPRGVSNTIVKKLGNLWYYENNPRIESFDISGKVDQRHFVYKLNEEAIPREARKMGLQVEKVPNLNVPDKFNMTTRETVPGSWWKISIPKEMAKQPVSAYGAAPIKSILGGAVAATGIAALFVPSKEAFDRKEFEKTEYKIKDRPVKVIEKELEKLGGILFAEANNNIDEMRKIANVIINRAAITGTSIEKQITKQSKNGGFEFNGYGTKQYNNFVTGNFDFVSKRKAELVKQILEEIRKGTIEDNTNLHRYFSHNKQGELKTSHDVYDNIRHANSIK